MNDLLDFTKIVYTETMMHLEDFSYSKIVHVIKPNGIIETTEFLIKHAYDKNIETEKKLISKTYKEIEPDLIKPFVYNVLEVISKPEHWSMMIDDCSGTLDIYFGDAMKIRVDRAVTNGNEYVGSLFWNLIKNASELLVD